MTTKQKQRATVQFATLMGWSPLQPRIDGKRPCLTFPYYWIRFDKDVFVRRSESDSSEIFDPWNNPADAIELAVKMRVVHVYDPIRKLYMAWAVPPEVTNDDATELTVEEARAIADTELFDHRADNLCTAITDACWAALAKI